MTTEPANTISMMKVVPAKWSTKYNDDDADLELISSDGWHFKVHSYRLQTVSSVFRSMIPMAKSFSQRDPITFTDERLEVGIVIRTFLDFAYTWSLNDVGDSDNTNSNLYLIDFATKWDCQPVLEMVERDIQVRLGPTQSSNSKFDMFLLSIKMCNYELAGQCIRQHDHWGVEWTLNPNDDLPSNFCADRSLPRVDGPMIEGSCVFDLSAGCLESFLSIPPTIVYVLLRADRLAEGDDDDRSHVERLGDHFVELMREAYPLKTDTSKSSSKRRRRDEI